MTTDTRTTDDRFVEFGPEQARRAREAAGQPEPRADVPPDAGFLRRMWIWLTQGNGEHRKLWASQTRDDGEPKSDGNGRT